MTESCAARNDRVLVLGFGAEVAARTARLYGGWMRLASGGTPQPNPQFAKSKSWPGKACHRDGAVFATAAICDGLAQIATPLRGSQ
ncbi:MAG: hypothetical protein ACYDGL_11865 [Bellilinea sp.]